MVDTYIAACIQPFVHMCETREKIKLDRVLGKSELFFRIFDS